MGDGRSEGEREEWRDSEISGLPDDESSSGVIMLSNDEIKFSAKYYFPTFK